MFDTHAHLNFKVFGKNLDWVIADARTAGVNNIIVPGTDIISSQKAVEIAEKYSDVYAAVGIHPHHVFDLFSSVILNGVKDPGRKADKNVSLDFSVVFQKIAQLLQNDIGGKIVAIGEIGLDKHQYQKTKYENYQVTPEFFEIQKILFIEQLKLAVKYKKSVIIHNRDAIIEILEILDTPAFTKAMAGKVVFHCCEPDDRLLKYAIDHHIYIGVDGDVTYPSTSSLRLRSGQVGQVLSKKQEFIKKVPLDLLVLETDSPYLAPVRDKKRLKFPNTPANLPVTVGFIAKLRNESLDVIKKTTTNNARKLFSI